MYRCEYCNRYLKNKYDKCPGCGSNKLKRMQNYNEERIMKVPKGGYIVNLKNYEHYRNKHRIYIFLGVLGVIVLFYFGSLFLRPFFIDFDLISVDTLLLIPFAIFILFFIRGILKETNVLGFINKEKKTESNIERDINRIKHLSEHGMLIKNLKYTIRPATRYIDGAKTIYKIVVTYEIEDGKTMDFESEPKLLTALGRDDGTVDLLIDPDDYSNYFIDFEIY